METDPARSSRRSGPVKLAARPKKQGAAVRIDYALIRPTRGAWGMVGWPDTRPMRERARRFRKARGPGREPEPLGKPVRKGDRSRFTRRDNIPKPIRFHCKIAFLIAGALGSGSACIPARLLHGVGGHCWKRRDRPYGSGRIARQIRFTLGTADHTA
jgi:hypothetical protein